MPAIRTLIVDDEPLARVRLTKLLAGFAFVDLIGESKNGREALLMIRKHQPDLVFLDVQMPDLNGFDVLSEEMGSRRPFVIFVTAFDQYALRAFDVQAVDYLLKPFDDERFEQALLNAKRHIEIHLKAGLHEQMVQLIDKNRVDDPGAHRMISLKDKGREKVIRPDAVHYIESDGNYVHIYLDKDRFFHRQTLQELESMLPVQYFLRIHRSTLINTLHVSKVRYEGEHLYSFTFPDGRKVMSSRGYKSAVVKWLDETKH